MMLSVCYRLCLKGRIIEARSQHIDQIIFAVCKCTKSCILTNCSFRLVLMQVVGLQDMG